MQTDQGRRKFFRELTKLVGSGVLLTAPFPAAAGHDLKIKNEWTVGQIMDAFIKQVPGAPFSKTVDTLKSGSRDTKVTGIVTTMFATMEVIKKAMGVKANFIIAHEPTFYNHQDDTEWLENDEVYREKSRLLAKNNITVWRNHDYVHSLRPDGVMTGVIDQLGWRGYAQAGLKGVVTIPSVTLEVLIAHLKQKLGAEMIRYVGDLKQQCSKVIIMPGAAGGRTQIQSIGMERPDVLVVGEISEWETAEYVRDACSQGKKISLVILGHAFSEEPGSAFMAGWLKKNIPGVVVTHIRSGAPFHYL